MATSGSTPAGAVGEASRAVAIFVLTASMFVISLLVVFYGFIGYYSRISLSGEFAKDKQNIDFVFALIEQVKRDEAELPLLREQKTNVGIRRESQFIEAESAAYASDEHKKLVDAFSAVIQYLHGFKENLTQEYWEQVGAKLLLATLLGLSTAEQIHTVQLILTPGYVTENPLSGPAKIEFYNGLVSRVQEFRHAVISYNATYGQRIAQARDGTTAEISLIDDKLRQIFARNPQLASESELRSFRLEKIKIDQERLRTIAQQRAVLGAYDSVFIGFGRSILQAPTIASTLLVTLAMGWLGGLIGFMGATLQSRRLVTQDPDRFQESEFVSLFRRSFLGLAAALGIFLFFGSGLLVLTAQGGQAVSPNSIELSPYFVAFLAFISGFLADDAFSRLRKAGQSIFQSDGNGVQQSSGAGGADTIGSSSGGSSSGGSTAGTSSTG